MRESIALRIVGWIVFLSHPLFIAFTDVKYNAETMQTNSLIFVMTICTASILRALGK